MFIARMSATPATARRISDSSLAQSIVGTRMPESALAGAAGIGGLAGRGGVGVGALRCSLMPAIANPEVGVESSSRHHTEKTMRIGDLAESTGTAVETIRFYEREGLIPAAQRADNNYRVYTARPTPSGWRSSAIAATWT
jgi:hypothetical protein